MSNEIIKHLSFGSEARENVFNGIDKLYLAVSSTLGASGKCVLLEDGSGNPVVTKDGVTVANAVTLIDPIENMGATLLKQAARKTVEEAGDGTTTATILAHSIISEAQKINGFSEREVKAGINSATLKVLKYLEDRAIEVSGDMLKHVATISSNNDEELGDIISSAFNASGKGGVVTMEISRDENTSFEVVNGATLDKPLKNFHFITDKDSGSCVLNNPLVLIVENKIDNIRKIEPILAYVIKNNKELLIIGDADEQVVSALAMNKIKGNIKVNVVDAPDYGINRKERMQDLAVITGATVINEDLGDDMDLIQPEHLGECSKAITNKEETILEVDELNEDVKELVDLVKSQMEDTKFPGKKMQLEKRLAILSCKVSVIKVGANSEVELKEKSDRVEDAICATRAAIKEGILPGGGVALLNASNKVKASNEVEQALLRAIRKPYEVIMTNGEYDEIIYDKRTGYGVDVKTGKIVNMINAGIIDPLLVTKSALKNAVSVSTTIMSTNCVINNLRQK
jgi:chaperonin GroEL